MNTYWLISEAYLEKQDCCVVGCKERPKYEFLTEFSEGIHDTILACEKHIEKDSVLDEKHG